MFDVLAAPFLDPGSRTFWPFLLAAVGGIAVWAAVRAWRGSALDWRWHPSMGLDLQLLAARQLIRAIGLLPAMTGALGVAMVVGGWLSSWGRPDLDLPSGLVAGIYTLVLFVAWDASRYLVHRWMHASGWLWQFHQVHHSAEVLTPLTFHRVHPVESIVYGVRGVLVTGTVTAVFYWATGDDVLQWTFMGVHAIGFVLNGLTGNLRHSHVPLGFGRLERWFISPVQHQIHHGLDGHRSNYGTWLAVWDRLGGSLVAQARPPSRFGIPVEGRNHGNDLVSAWLGPFLSLRFRDPIPAPVVLSEPLDQVS